ncbi:MAG: hypothetical protein WC380_11040, partial [Pedobacter sp.]
MKAKIRNIDELNAEILRLREQRVEMEADMLIDLNKIVSKFKMPLMLISKLGDWASAFAGVKTNKDGTTDNGDWISGIFRVGLPFVMNRFIFPKSGLLTKTILGFITQKAAGTVNKDLISNILDKISGIVKIPKNKKKNGH